MHLEKVTIHDIGTCLLVNEVVRAITLNGNHFTNFFYPAFNALDTNDTKFQQDSYVVC